MVIGRVKQAILSNTKLEVRNSRWKMRNYSIRTIKSTTYDMLSVSKLRASTALAITSPLDSKYGNC